MYLRPSRATQNGFVTLRRSTKPRDNGSHSVMWLISLADTIDRASRIDICSTVASRAKLVEHQSSLRCSRLLAQVVLSKHSSQLVKFFRNVVNYLR